LPIAIGQEIAELYWSANPHLAAALMWEYYAAMLAPSPSVASVSTGVQSVAYTGPGGAFGLAVARAEWHRSQLGDLASVPVVVGPGGANWPPDWWQRNLDDPLTWEALAADP
jgi:hypothetical protein